MSTPQPVRDWVRLERYCELKGDTPDAVHARRRKRQWTEGVQSIVGRDGKVWVCIEEVNRWIQGLPPSGGASSGSHAE